MTSFTNRLGLRRNILLGTTISALSVFLGVSAASCQSLPDIAANQCGNWVVETKLGEACDEDTELCGAPATPGACRYLCGYGESNDGKCPEGFGCGLDLICRKSGGLSETSISIAGGGTQKLLSGDFDDDGRQDIVSVGVSTVDIDFLTTEGLVDRTVTLPNEMGIPGVGDVNGDFSSDIVLTLDRSVGVLLGQEDRSFIASGYPTMFAAPNTKRLIPLGTYTKDNIILSISDDGTSTSIEFLALNKTGGHSKMMAPPPPLAGIVQGAVATTGVTIGQVGCGIAAFELSSPKPAPARLAIGTRCNNSPVEIFEFPFNGGGDPWGGAFFGDLENDGEPDLFFGVDTISPTLKVIKNFRIAGSQPMDFLTYDEGNCNATNASLASAPLAIGDINGDFYPDVVDGRGVIFTKPGGLPDKYNFSRQCLSYVWHDETGMDKTSVGWTNAVIADFNGDGRNDVLALRKNLGILDLWTWQSGGFNTVQIFVGGPVAEIVAGDIDGDTIADAAFRFVEPAPMNGMPNMPNMPDMPWPIYVMYGNPLGLPSKPKLVGYVKGMENLAIGRMRGINWAGESDVLSDLAVLGRNQQQQPEMPLYFFQGDTTRNLVSPLTLQTDSTMDVGSSDSVYGIFVSEFGVDACEAERAADGETLYPSNIVTFGEGRIWLAGCKANGSSLAIDDGIGAADASFLFAPVDPDPDPDSTTTTDEHLATFMNTPTSWVQNTPPPSTLGLGQITYKGGQSFDGLLPNLDAIDANMQLPNPKLPDAPYAFADIDDNGTQDVILTAQTTDSRTIYIFWNGGDDKPAGTLDARVFTKFDFKPPTITMPQGPMGGGPRDDTTAIMDVVALNLDGDRFKELAVLTQDHVYLLKLATQTITDKKTTTLALEQGRPLQWFSTGQPFTNVRGGQALLAIDANSDGIDDLVVADQGKLLLFVGTERLQ